MRCSLIKFVHIVHKINLTESTYSKSSCGFCDSGIGFVDFFPRGFRSAVARLDSSKCTRISLARSRISLGKPASRDEAAEMLAALSGKRHEVLTAVALQQDDWLESALSVSEVEFKKLSDEEIRQYIASGESDDKAGAYAIQGRAARFVVELRGSYSGVVGLPLYETSRLLDRVRERR